MLFIERKSDEKSLLSQLENKILTLSQFIRVKKV